MAEQWVTVYETGMEYRANMVRDILQQEDIPAMIINNQDSNYHFGQVEVRVPASYSIRALKTVEDEIDFQ